MSESPSSRTRLMVLAAVLAAAGVVCLVGWFWQRAEGPSLQAGVNASLSMLARSAAPAPVALPSSAADLPEKPAVWADTPMPEPEYLAELRSLNATDKAAALLLVEKGERWYSAEGRPAEARRAMRVTLLVDLNRMPEARAFTREFAERYPESSYLPLVRGVTGIHPRPSRPAAR